LQQRPYAKTLEQCWSGISYNYKYRQEAGNMPLEVKSRSPGLLTSPPIAFKIYCWGFPIFWNIFGQTLLNNHVFPSMAYLLLAVDFIVSVSIVAFFCTQWFRQKFVFIMVAWAVLFFPIYLFTSGGMSQFYVYVFQNMLHPWQARPYWHFGPT